MENSPRLPGEWRHRKKDGTVIDVEVAPLGVYWGRRARLALVTDITERKLAEATTRAFLHISEKVNALLDVDIARGIDESAVRVGNIGSQNPGSGE